ncbi:cupin domain-containing protein [Sphaerobacter sp.]|uniref:helix-turn-helix domain-containing protein n=1 Tax=Sphaerobacter sp. TaxID=2099654 RepID=UPI0025F2BEC2|nr:cupin domain-containing protein [Sphaerobacter sp.]
MRAAGPNGGGIRIGQRLRAARQQRSLSLEQVARLTGLTKGFLSQVERDLASPSVASLLAICDAVGLPIGALFQPAQTDLVTAENRAPINFGGDRVTEFLLTPSGERRLQVIESHIEPGGGSGDGLYSLPADAEFVHVLAGRLEIEVDGTHYRLTAGDSLTFSARAPHCWRNPSPHEVAHVIWVLVPSPW